MILGIGIDVCAARLHGPARELAERMGVTRVHISITHDAGVAAAVAILEGM